MAPGIPAVSSSVRNFHSFEGSYNEIVPRLMQRLLTSTVSIPLPTREASRLASAKLTPDRHLRKRIPSQHDCGQGRNAFRTSPPVYD